MTFEAASVYYCALDWGEGKIITLDSRLDVQLTYPCPEPLKSSGRRKVLSPSPPVTLSIKGFGSYLVLSWLWLSVRSKLELCIF